MSASQRITSCGPQRLQVEDAAVRSGQVQVQRRPLAQIAADLAAVHAGDLAAFVEDRDHQGAIEMLVAALAEEAKLLQRLRISCRPCVLAAAAGPGCGSQSRAGNARSPRMSEAARFQVGQRLGRLLQRLVVVVDGLSR